LNPTLHNNDWLVFLLPLFGLFIGYLYDIGANLPTAALYVIVACFVSYLFSGGGGIYSSQRRETPKYSAEPD
jgi:hypothetical protein